MQNMLTLGRNSSVIRDIFEYSRQRKAQIGPERVFDFSLGNPSIPAPVAVGQTMQRLLQTCDALSLHGYTSAAGDMAVREKIAQRLTARFGLPHSPALLYLTCGAAASLAITLRALISSGDEVLLLAPYFPEYTVFAQNAGARVKTVPCLPGSFHLDLAALEAAITEKTRAILINSPNNPSGVVFDEPELRALSALLVRKRAAFGHPITLISDEPYRELVYDGIVPPYLPCLYDDTISCYSYSKSLSLPGERIGYIYVAAQAPEAVFAAICGAGRSMGYVCAPSFMQYTVAECGGFLPELAAYDKNRRLLYHALTEIGYSAVYPQGAFYLLVHALEADAGRFCERAKALELLLVPCDDFGISGYVRLAYCVSYDQIVLSLPAFRALYQQYQGETE